MTRQSAIIESHLQSIEERAEKKPWERLPDEPLFWYNRYKRFQGLGPKRTMLAALQQERAKSPAQKSTQKQENGAAKKSVSVPGSWKAASIRWNWVARAQAYDEDKIERAVAALFESLYEGPAMAFNRIQTLTNISESITNDFNAHRAYMSFQERIAYYAQMRRILHDIAEEMKAFDAPTQALLVRHYAAKEYKDHKSPTTPEGYVQLVEKAGGQAAFNEQLAAEVARRKELAQVGEMLAEL